jgi:hypothetical protein
VVWWFARRDEVPEAYGLDVLQIDEIVATKTMGDLAIYRK